MVGWLVGWWVGGQGSSSVLLVCCTIKSSLCKHICKRTLAEQVMPFVYWDSRVLVTLTIVVMVVRTQGYFCRRYPDMSAVGVRSRRLTDIIEPPVRIATTKQRSGRRWNRYLFHVRTTEA